MPDTPSARRYLLLVAGAGRSGTSLVTGLVGRLGFHIPVPEVTADSSNPRGFGEPRWAVDFHTELLQQANVAPEDGRPEAWDAAADVAGRAPSRERLRRWLDEQFAVSDRVVIKDPRLTWFVELYRVIAEDMGVEVGVLTMLRDPAESVKSRELAYGMKSSPSTRTASWLNMMLGLEARTRSMSRAYVPYDGLMEDWREHLRRAEDALGMPLITDASDEHLADADALVDKSLRRARADWDTLGLTSELRELADGSYSALRELVGEDGARAHTTLDELRSDYLSMYEAAAELTRSRVRAARVEERRRAAREKKTTGDTRPRWRRLLGR